MLDRNIAPPIKDAVDFTLTLPPYEHFKLKNGVPVYVVNTGAQEVAQVEFVFYAGNWDEQKTGVASAANALIKNGTKNKTAFELNEAFDYFGAFCNRSCHSETATIKLNSLSKNLKDILPLVAEMITESIYPDDELATYKQNYLQKLQVSLKKSDFVASRMIDAYLYGEAHPYGRYSTAANIEALEAEEIKNFYKQYYTEGKCVIFVSGKFSEDLEVLFNKYFGYLPMQAPDYKQKPYAWEPIAAKKHIIENDKNAQQGAIRIASPFIDKLNPDFKKCMLLNTIFGGYFGSRLMNNIREDKGYTYGIHSYIQNHIQETALVITTDAGKDVSEATVKEVFKEMEILRNEPIPKEELHVVKNYMMGSILGGLDGPFHIMSKWKNIILNNMDENYFYDTVTAIRETSAEELQALAKKYLVEDAFYELIVY